MYNDGATQFAGAAGYMAECVRARARRGGERRGDADADAGGRMGFLKFLKISAPTVDGPGRARGGVASGGRGGFACGGWLSRRAD